MRVAIVSCEYLDEVPVGGIGTYSRNLSRMLRGRGHDVEVFCAGTDTRTQTDIDGLKVHVIRCERRGDFPGLIAPIFIMRNAEKAFDLVEGAEFMAETSAISEALPDLPLVVKLHTPGSLIEHINAEFIPLRSKARFILGGIRRGRLSRPYWLHDRRNDFELRAARRAHLLTAPSVAMADAVQQFWGICAERIMVVPNVFVPPPSLLELEPVDSKLVCYFGRIEIRKGVLDFASAIPMVLSSVPEAKFRFVGRVLDYPGTAQSLENVIKRDLGMHAASVEFIPPVPYDEITEWYKDASVCVVPSLWENFPNTVLEGMAAGRALVACRAGGIGEMVIDESTGLLVEPRNPRALARAIVRFLENGRERREFGARARASVLAQYSADAIGPIQEKAYAEAVRRCPSREFELS